jgi:5'-methylthioadenosine phosphorylase
MVGMTGMSEAVLARELGVPYAAVCVVTNWAAGRGDNMQAIAFADIEATLQALLSRVRRLIKHFSHKFRSGSTYSYAC